jgi:predicted membrane channel-forming protein YqfA (hemolysin III family)
MPVIAQNYGPERKKTAPERNETELERCDRNLVELLQEVRVAQTGVQVLFGFLLAIVFTPRFRSISTFQRFDYFATLLATSAAAVLLIAPTAYHRILFRRGDKQYLVKVANRCTVFGLAAIAVAMIGVVLLISDVMFSSTVTIATTTIVAAGCATTWFLMPLARRRALSQRRHSPSAAAVSAPPRPGSRAPTRP